MILNLFLIFEFMKGFKTNLTSTLFGIRNALGFLLSFVFCDDRFRFPAQEQGLSLWISMLSTVLIWGMPGQVVHVLYGLGAPNCGGTGSCRGKCPILPMTLLDDASSGEKPPSSSLNYLLVHMISINTWAEMMRKGMRSGRTPGCLFSRLFLNLHVCRGFGVIQGYLLLENMPKLVSLCLLFLVPIYFALIISNTTHPFFAGIWFGLPVGSDFSSMDSGMGFGDCGTIAGTIAFYSGTTSPC